MTNIIDGMDSARFQSANNPGNKQRVKKVEKEDKKMPTVLKDLKNGS
ncbi:hypothetical protein ACFFHM_15550 [Halalkalibacter kiskunsagensis]|uniref:Uncharacterized protein n=1 Tax=Halalkalibacter kiskunsagensis TaxID=1548599 RepID=A0ABV6KFZ0_9BACI